MLTLVAIIQYRIRQEVEKQAEQAAEEIETAARFYDIQFR